MVVSLVTIRTRVKQLLRNAKQDWMKRRGWLLQAVSKFESSDLFASLPSIFSHHEFICFLGVSYYCHNNNSCFIYLAMCWGSHLCSGPKFHTSIDHFIHTARYYTIFNIVAGIYQFSLSNLALLSYFLILVKGTIPNCISFMLLSSSISFVYIS